MLNQNTQVKTNPVNVVVSAMIVTVLQAGAFYKLCYKFGLMPPQYGAPAAKFGQICREPCTACLVRNSRGIPTQHPMILNTRTVYAILDLLCRIYGVFWYVLFKVWDRSVRAGEEYAV